ncbi:hypothetical protein KSS87_008285 [Heliosperma pusillum]|nr:hypothetical protein KSS87_008285 [Heliosperma pusillum]
MNVYQRTQFPVTEKADLIFVPMVWEDHYFCVCINFTSEMVEVLDNKKYDKWEETLIYKAADLLASYMSDYLEGKGDERAIEFVGFPVVHIKFNWQTYEENNIESGNFLMMHMIWVKEFSATKDEIWKEVKPKRGKTGTVKEKKGVAEEKGKKVDSPTKEKEDTIEKTRINTEIHVLHNPLDNMTRYQGILTMENQKESLNATRGLHTVGVEVRVVVVVEEETILSS